MAKQSMQLDNETQVRNFLEAQVEAIRNKNAEKVASGFAPNSVQFLQAPPLVYKGENDWNRERIQGWFDTFEGGLGYDIKDLEITADDNIAFSHCLIRMAGKQKEQGDFEIWVRETICLRKLDGEWKITHYHESVPFYMDGSYKAAVDLKP